jgi:hypothetical protein
MCFLFIDLGWNYADTETGGARSEYMGNLDKA